MSAVAVQRICLPAFSRRKACKGRLVLRRMCPLARRRCPVCPGHGVRDAEYAAREHDVVVAKVAEALPSSLFTLDFFPSTSRAFTPSSVVMIFFFFFFIIIFFFLFFFFLTDER